MNRSTNFGTIFVGIVALLVVVAFYRYGRSIWVPTYQAFAGQRTVTEVLNEIGPSARQRLKKYFVTANAKFPPESVTLLALKDSAQLELWVGSEQSLTYIRTYVIQALSGKLGPKLREGDRQVPEGIYKIEGLNPNSRYHLSMKLNYPNAFDLRHAADEGRTEPGTNIFIHGKAVSIGCLAMGDSAIEELFVLAADSGRENIRVVISPTDPRITPLSNADERAWVDELYRDISLQFEKYRHDEI